VANAVGAGFIYVKTAISNSGASIGKYTPL